LNENKVEFNIGQLINQGRLENEVLPKYPKHKAEIQMFVHQMKSSLKIALVIIVSIVFIGIVLNGFYN